MVGTRQPFDIETFVTLGLGDNTFLVGSGDEAALIDPVGGGRRCLPKRGRIGLPLLGVTRSSRLQILGQSVDGSAEHHR